MERKRDFRGRFRLGAEMETSSDANGEIEDGHSERLHKSFILPVIGELLVKYKRPKYDFEKWDWMLFQWPHDRDDANFEMGISELEATFEADRKRYDDFIERKERVIDKKEISQSKSVSSQGNQETDEDFFTNNPEITKNYTLNWIDESQYFSLDTDTSF